MSEKKSPLADVIAAVEASTAKISKADDSTSTTIDAQTAARTTGDSAVATNIGDLSKSIAKATDDLAELVKDKSGDAVDQARDAIAKASTAQEKLAQVLGSLGIDPTAYEADDTWKMLNKVWELTSLLYQAAQVEQLIAKSAKVEDKPADKPASDEPVAKSEPAAFAGWPLDMNSAFDEKAGGYVSVAKGDDWK